MELEDTCACREFEHCFLGCPSHKLDGLLKKLMIVVTNIRLSNRRNPHSHWAKVTYGSRLLNGFCGVLYANWTLAHSHPLFLGPWLLHHHPSTTPSSHPLQGRKPVNTSKTLLFCCNRAPPLQFYLAWDLTPTTFHKWFFACCTSSTSRSIQPLKRETTRATSNPSLRYEPQSGEMSTV